MSPPLIKDPANVWKVFIPDDRLEAAAAWLDAWCQHGDGSPAYAVESGNRMGKIKLGFANNSDMRRFLEQFPDAWRPGDAPRRSA